MSYPEEKTYDLDLNVNTMDKLTVVSDTEIKIEGSEDFMDAKGEIKSRPYAYKVTFAIGKDGAPSDTVQVTRL